MIHETTTLTLDFSNTNVLVIGDIMLDQYWNGPALRISPEAPVPVVLVNSLENRIGGAGNVAVNMAILGSQVKIFAYCGVDDTARVLIELLQNQGIKQYLTLIEKIITTTKIRVISQQQQLLRLDKEQNLEEISLDNLFLENSPDRLINKLIPHLKTAQVMVLSDYAKGTLADPQLYIQAAKCHGVKVIVDPKQLDFSVYKHADVITPNLKEFQQVVGKCNTRQQMIERGLNLLEKHKITTLVLTLGAEGILVLEKNKTPFHVPARGAEVYDVTGAGDTVVALLALALAKNKSIEIAAKLASIAAGMVVGKMGTAAVTIHELQQACEQEGLFISREKLNQLSMIPMGVINKEKLIPILRQVQSTGEKIVFVNGCYDILHHGHINYLTTAKALGDRLVVGVNDDHSVALSKGPNRPINKLADRMAVLAGLKAVDWVVPFSELTPGKLIDEIAPDILVKTDEKFKTIAEYPANEGIESVLAKGGEVKIIERTENISSSKIIKFI